MSDKGIVDPEKLSLVDCKIIKGQVETPEDFSISKVEGHRLDHGLELGFNLDDKLVKVDYTIDIQTDSKGGNEVEATVSFHFAYVYKVENLENLVLSIEEDKKTLDPVLSSTLTSISYSTSRGILITRLQGTAFQNFILPIINPNNLFT